MGSGLAAKRRGSRGRRRARCAHLTAEGVRCWPFAPRELRFWAQPAADGHPLAHPTGCPSAPALSTSQAQKDTGRGALRSLPLLPAPEQRLPGRLPSGCNVTQPRRRRLPCSSSGRDASRGRARAAAPPTAVSSALAWGPRPGRRGVSSGVGRLPTCQTYAALFVVCTKEEARERLEKTIRPPQ